REMYEKFGAFNTSFDLSADYELMLRLIHKNKIKIGYIPESIVNMKMGGVSNTSVWGKVKANIEDKRAWKVNGLNPGFLTTIRKPLSKVGQYFKIGS
ncbi:MAG: glycosyltransferase, partial [Bacteroidia bacterium]|nr:glycosyltransferase [Bacteroidia bacterium]